MDEKLLKEFSTHICNIIAESVKGYLWISFTLGFGCGACFFCILYLFLKG